MHSRFIRRLSDSQILSILESSFTDSPNVNYYFFKNIKRTSEGVEVKFSWFDIFLRDFELRSDIFSEIILEEDIKALEKAEKKYIGHMEAIFGNEYKKERKRALYYRDPLPINYVTLKKKREKEDLDLFK